MRKSPEHRPAILVTGGAGYIGSHTCVRLVAAGYRPVILDNFSNSARVAVDRVREVAGAGAGGPLSEGDIPLIEGDVRDVGLVTEVLEAHQVTGVIHFAALKAVGESVAEPLRYFNNNIGGTLALLEAMAAARVGGRTGVGRLVFSSSCTVYGDPARVPVDESAPLSAANPYGRTKLVMEEVIGELCRADPRFSAVLLRYFNPVGAHPSGRLGEDPRGIPGNLVPYAAQVAVGRRERLQVFGGDWPTPDGTGIRDYIHVVDLAEAHVAALRHVETRMAGGEVIPINLGTGAGHSVLQVVQAFAAACGREIPYDIVGRRPGDVARVWADPRRAQDLLGWRAERSLEEMCADAWRWQRMNPNGYEDEEG